MKLVISLLHFTVCVCWILKRKELVCGAWEASISGVLMVRAAGVQYRWSMREPAMATVVEENCLDIKSFFSSSSIECKNVFYFWLHAAAGVDAICGCGHYVTRHHGGKSED